MFIFKERLLEIHRASWLKVKDLGYIDKQLIPPLLENINESIKYRNDLAQTAIEIAAEEQAKADAKSRGEVGLKKVEKKAPTRPISPKLHQTRPPILPQPERIDNTVVSKPVPSVIYNTASLSEIDEKNKERREYIKEKTKEKYNKNHEFKLNETKYGKKTEEIRQELEEELNANLDFNRSFYNPPPSSSTNADIKNNVSSILREDYLFRKQQKKDAEILRKYEEELHDPTEYLRWQQEMKEFNHQEKMKMVNMRRELAKQSSIDAKIAIEKQQADNKKVGKIMREQNEIIKKQKEIESSIEVLKKQEQVQAIMEVRETKPVHAIKKIYEENIHKGKEVREELKSLIELKEIEDREKEIVKADKIRQLKALNTVHRKHFTIFDPTETSKGDFLNEMSYLEMKERISMNKRLTNEEVQHKNEEINEEKQKKMQDLKSRTNIIERARNLKAETRQANRQKIKSILEKEKLDLQTMRSKNEELWAIESKKRREEKQREQDQLREEEERIKRQQQYLGVAHSQVAAVREKQIELAKNRQISKEIEEYNKSVVLNKLVEQKERKNKLVIEKEKKKEKEALDIIRKDEVEFEKAVCVDKLKDMVIYKKSMFLEGQEQHNRTKRVLYETNPYATKITVENRTEMMSMRK